MSNKKSNLEYIRYTDISSANDLGTFLLQKNYLSDSKELRESFEKCFNVYNSLMLEENIIARDTFFEYFFKNVVCPNKDKMPSLFRYSPADYYNIRNLETETLMLSSIGNMNDIFEGLAGEIETDIITSLGELKDIAYIKSFSELKNDFLMWSHYGDKYAGMCVEYDFSKLDESILCHLFPVIYSDTRYSVKIFCDAVEELYELKKANKENYYPDLFKSLMDIMALFLIKPKPWNYEKEWRIIATYPQIHNLAGDFYEEYEDKKILMYDINSELISVKNCIKSVYIGPRTPKIQREHIQSICSKLNGVKLYQLSVSKAEYTFYEIEKNCSNNALQSL